MAIVDQANFDPVVYIICDLCGAVADSGYSKRRFFERGSIDMAGWFVCPNRDSIVYLAYCATHASFHQAHSSKSEFIS